MLHKKWLNLQLFAGDGAGDGGGEAAATGETNADAGHQRLRELGVPESKIRKNRAYKLPGQAPASTQAVQKQEENQEAQQAAAAKNPTEETKTDPATMRLTWDEIMADPEYNKEMQATIRARLKSEKGAEETLGKLTPALEVLARQHGMDPANIDYDALAKKIYNEDRFYEDKALEMGVTVDTARKIDQMELDAARQKRQEQKTIEDQRMEQHIASIHRQAEEMKKVFPNFDLKTEMQNPYFVRMTHPNIGMSVEAAYHAIHFKEIQAAAMQVTAQKTAQMMSNSIQAGSRRPSENGTSGQAPSVTTFDYSKASPEQRNAFKKHIRSEAAQGRKVYPGSYSSR